MEPPDYSVARECLFRFGLQLGIGAILAGLLLNYIFRQFGGNDHE